jgi:hypothetical protein
VVHLFGWPSFLITPFLPAARNLNLIPYAGQARAAGCDHPLCPPRSTTADAYQISMPISARSCPIRWIDIADLTWENALLNHQSGIFIYVRGTDVPRLASVSF